MIIRNGCNHCLSISQWFSIVPNRYNNIPSYIDVKFFRSFFFSSRVDFISFHFKRRNRNVQLYAYSTIQMMSIYYEKPFSPFRFSVCAIYIHVLFQERLLLFNVKFVFNIHLSNSDTQTHIHTRVDTYKRRKLFLVIDKRFLNRMNEHLQLSN